MVTLKLSAGTVFSLGLVTGIIVGVIGLTAVAYAIVKKNNKER